VFRSQRASARKPIPSDGAEDFDATVRAHEAFVNGIGEAPKSRLSYIVARGMCCDHRRLMDIDFASADLSHTTFIETNLTRAVFDDALLHFCNFQGAVLRGASLRRAELPGARMKGADLDGVDLRAAALTLRNRRLSQRRPFAEFVGARLDNAQLDGVLAQGADFSHASLRGARLCHAALDGATFDGADLDGADLEGAQLAKATFRGAVLTGVDIDALGLPPQAIAGCLRDPSAAALAQAPVIRRALDEAECWIDSGGAAGAPAALADVDLRVVHDAIRGRRLGPLVATGSVAVGVDLSGAQLQGANFEGADLRRANFRGADLRGASFQGANLAHASLFGAETGPLSLPNGRELPTRFDGARIDGAEAPDRQTPISAPR
jgi:uncharacterized protein YjbI with pentapeptide repeats